MKIEKVKYIFLSKNKIKLFVQLNYLKTLQKIYGVNYKEENINLLNEDIKKVFITTEY
tara:strand:- start:88 stop:261 length:174 start_codon:yes stop_codon:yes gene_type:complete